MNDEEWKKELFNQLTEEQPAPNGCLEKSLSMAVLIQQRYPT